MKVKKRAPINLSFEEVHNALEDHKYLIFVDEDYHKTGYNGGIVDMDVMKNEYNKVDKNKRSVYIGFYPCDLQEYITYKVGFK